jgi:hypothetical protein
MACGLKILGRCEFSPGIPVNVQSWRFECSTIKIVDRDVRVLAEQP